MKIKRFNEFINESKQEREKFNVLYHGTDLKSAKNIEKVGVHVNETGGYFGHGFYTTDDFNLAKNNYADFVQDDNDKGVVVEFKLSPKANILDLRISSDFDKWKSFNIRVTDDEAYKKLISLGVDGLYDESFGGVIIYNTKVLKFIKIIYHTDEAPIGNYIDGDDKLTDEQYIKIEKEAKLINNVPIIMMVDEINRRSKVSSQTVYNGIIRSFDNEKKAKLFLKKCGIDGITSTKRDGSKKYIKF